MKKLFLLIAAIMMSSAGLWANDITYTATAALTYKELAFDAGITSHTWDKSTKVGVISFSGNVATIGNSAFINCGSMTSMTLPNTITKIEEDAFMECTKLATINIPNSVTTIKYYAFHKCMSLSSITIPNAVTEIGAQAFKNCYALTSVTFEGSACQNAIGADAFGGVGTDTPATLTLPEDWNYANAPESNSTAWYGGNFNSNLYSTEGATDKQAAIDAVTAILGDYSTNAYLQSLLAEEITKINNATNRRQVNERKQNAVDKLLIAVTCYDHGRAEAKTELLGTLGTKQNGPALIVTDKDGKEIILYSPKSVEYIKVKE